MPSAVNSRSYDDHRWCSALAIAADHAGPVGRAADESAGSTVTDFGAVRDAAEHPVLSYRAIGLPPGLRALSLAGSGRCQRAQLCTGEGCLLVEPSDQRAVL